MILFYALLMYTCFDSNNTSSEISLTLNTKICGATFDGPSAPPITKEMVCSIRDVGGTWVSTTPEAFTYHQDLKVKQFYREGNWYSETTHGSIAVMKWARECGLKIMLKPHIAVLNDLSGWDEPEMDINNPASIQRWQEGHVKYVDSIGRKSNGSWRGDFAPKDPTDWHIWETGYRDFIMTQAHIADSMEVDLFCIGTELSKSAIDRPKFWCDLINDVRKVYSGPITYGANWDSYDKITFWDALDFIGISAYFPLSNRRSPSEKTLRRGWADHYNHIKALSQHFDRPVIFTEYGYISAEGAAKRPWSGATGTPSDEKLQARLYRSLYEQFWKEGWWAGGFIWKWYSSGNGGSTSYSPQGKVAQDVVKEFYKS